MISKMKKADYIFYLKRTLKKSEKFHIKKLKQLIAQIFWNRLISPQKAL